MAKSDDQHSVIIVKLDNIDEKIHQIHKTLHGNGRPGLVDQFNQWKGAVKVTQFLLGSGVASSILISLLL